MRANGLIHLVVKKIRKRTVNLNKKKWKIEFKLAKAHAGICGNEIEDRTAKEATQNHHITYSRIPKSAIKRHPGSIRNWQSYWKETTKGVILLLLLCGAGG
jgi:hypothetical protein